jgi:hypothetical protein
METYLEGLLKLVFLHQASKFWSRDLYGDPHWSCFALKNVKLRQSYRFTFHPPPLRLHPSRAFAHGSSAPIPRVPHAAPSDPPSPHDPRSPLLPPSPPPPTH